MEFHWQTAVNNIEDVLMQEFKERVGGKRFSQYATEIFNELSMDELAAITKAACSVKYICEQNTAAEAVIYKILKEKGIIK